MNGSNMNCLWHEWGTLVTYGIGSYKPYCNMNLIYSITSTTVAPSLDIMKANTSSSNTYLQQKYAKYGGLTSMATAVFQEEFES